MLDTTGVGRAAIAIGDVDRADNVAFVVPGLDQDVTQDMGRVVFNADRLRQTMDLNSAKYGQGTVATVAWLGYHTPKRE